MLTQTETGEIIFTHERCSQCGVCLGVCPHDALAAVYHKGWRYYDILLDKAKCTLCGLCVRVCPAPHLGEYTPNQDEISRAQGMYLAHARDDRVRKMSSSGGVARTLLDFVLSSCYADAAYSLIYPGATDKSSSASLPTMSDDKSFDRQSHNDLAHPSGREAEGTWLTQPVPYQSIPCSLYRPVMWGSNIARTEKTWRRIMLIGLPCQLKSARYYMDIARRKFDVLAVTIICRKQKTFGHTDYVKRLFHLETALDHDVFYRGGGWPGSSGVFTNENPKYTPYIFLAQCWNLPACDFCTDPLNARFSDITLADPWGLVQPGENEHGRNLVISWSDKGDNLLNAADAVLNRQQLAKELVYPNINFKSIELKDARARLFAQKRDNLSSKIKFALKRLNVKVVEWLTMRFTHKSRLFQLVQTLKSSLLKVMKNGKGVQ